MAEEALEHTDISTFFSDLAQNGCASGMVGKLIYYSDTADFYDRHYHEIEALREEWEHSTGTPLTINGDLKNFYAWFAFETVAFEIAQELGFS